MKNLKYILCTSFLAFGVSQAQNGDMQRAQMEIGQQPQTMGTEKAQDRNTKKADQEIRDFAYADAIQSYENLVEEGSSDSDVYKNLANANYLNANYKEAADWYTKLFAMDVADTDSEDMYRFAQSLKSTGDYKGSKEWMQKFKAAASDDIRAQNFANNTDFLEDIERLSGRYTIENLSINSAASDFAPAFDGKSLIFSTARDTGTVSRKVHGWNNKPFLNLYKASQDEDGTLGLPIKLSKNLNKKTHESSTAFTADGATMYFTRNNSENGRFARDEDGVSRLNIYRATLQDGEWKNIMALPFNGDAHSTAHPTLNADETKLYFASDREGSLGQSDIFVVDILENGTFSAPKNLGNTINTEARETFPFVTDSGILYFASDGHPGLGGLDIFAVDLKDSVSQKTVNLGKPVNGGEDDFSFIINEENKKGFFASNRDGGMGSDDIYRFTETEPIAFLNKKLIEGVVIDQETGTPLAGAKIMLHNSMNELLGETVSDKMGTFLLEDNYPKGSYRLMATKDEFKAGEEANFEIGNRDIAKMRMPLKKEVRQAAVGTDLIKHLTLRPVYFNLDKGDVRPDSSETLNKIIDYMKAFPKIKIEIQSHTDAKAGNAYNLRLSKKRAESTAAYLIESGIDATRISSEGFGEDRLINDCMTRESCTDEKHQENRRSEFIVVE